MNFYGTRRATPNVSSIYNTTSRNLYNAGTVYVLQESCSSVRKAHLHGLWSCSSEQRWRDDFRPLCQGCSVPQMFKEPVSMAQKAVWTSRFEHDLGRWFPYGQGGKRPSPPRRIVQSSGSLSTKVHTGKVLKKSPL